MIRAEAFKKDRKRKYWITLIIGKNRYHIKTSESHKLLNDLIRILVFDRPIRIKQLKGGKK